MRLVTDTERRARLAVRHALAPSARTVSVEEAAAAVVCLHGTDPMSVHLSAWARTRDLMPEDVDRALYDTRTLVRQAAMRETQFVFPRDLLSSVWGSASARAGGTARRRLLSDLRRWGGLGPEAGEAWLTAAEEAVLAYLADGVERPSARIRAEVPEVDGVLVHSPDRSWGGRQSLAPRVLSSLWFHARIARGAGAGPWHTMRPTWTTPSTWWRGAVPDPADPRSGYADLVARWLWSYGPGTLEDIAWWLGGTKRGVRDALADVQAQEVRIEGVDGPVPAWLHPEDLDPVASPGPWVALLPVLDPSVMGWTQRGFLLGQHGRRIFDSVGNAGTTAWVDGRVVGAWVQDPEGVVHLRPEERVSAGALGALTREAERLTAWLGGHRVTRLAVSEAMTPLPGS